MFKYPFSGFFKIMRELLKTFEGRYFSCLDIKEAKENNIISRFHRITSEKISMKLKKKRIWSLHTCSSTPVRGFIKIMHESPKTFERHYFSCLDMKEAKKK